MKYRTYLKINLDNLLYNYQNVRSIVPEGTKLLGVIKADAYGHGAVEIGKFLENKCDYFGVACIEEAIQLKKAGIKTPVLILGRVFPEDYSDVVDYDIRIPIFSYSDAKALSDEAVRKNKTVPFHFCIDTGMSRIGFQVSEESADQCKKITELPNISAEGLFSHYASADEADLSKAEKQKEKYIEFCSMLEKRGISTPIKHLSNSAGIMNFSEYFDMCRMGIVTYGLYPSEDVDKSLLDIRPVMSWHTKISYLKRLEAGREISYGGTYTTKEDTMIATIPVGYADGYPRCLSNTGKVLINGKYAPITGRVCMDQFMVDVTGIDCAEGDEVVLIGKQGDTEISMEAFSALAHSFNYEIPCRINPRVTRVYTYKDTVVSAHGLNG